MSAGTEQPMAMPAAFLHEMMWSEHKNKLKVILESMTETRKWSLDWSEEDDI